MKYIFIETELIPFKNTTGDNINSFFLYMAVIQHGTGNKHGELDLIRATMDDLKSKS